jgi:hypothetical protein
MAQASSVFPEEDAKECEEQLKGCKHTLAALFVSCYYNYHHEQPPDSRRF